MTISMNIKLFKTLMVFMMMIIIISSILVNFIHPLMLILLLVIYSIFNLMLMFIMTMVSIYMYMIFISIIGGMMIMFLYFTSMVNNHPSKIKMNELFMVGYLFIIMLISMVASIMSSSDPLENNLINSLNFNNIFIYKIYLFPLNLMTMITILNLLYCLVLTIKMCSSKYSPLRKITYEKI